VVLLERRATLRWCEPERTGSRVKLTLSRLLEVWVENETLAVEGTRGLTRRRVVRRSARSPLDYRVRDATARRPMAISTMIVGIARRHCGCECAGGIES
jgi:hypothetical protein